MLLSGGWQEISGADRFNTGSAGIDIFHSPHLASSQGRNRRFLRPFMGNHGNHDLFSSLVVIGRAIKRRSEYAAARSKTALPPKTAGRLVESPWQAAKNFLTVNINGLRPCFALKAGFAGSPPFILPGLNGNFPCPPAGSPPMPLASL